MSTTFPTAIDAFANPVGTDLLENATAALDHDFQHASANDAIEALEAKVGINGSAVTTSHDYKLSGITGSDKALSSGAGGGSQTITDLTLVNPKFTLGSDATGDMFYRDSGGNIKRLPIGTTGQIIQAGAGGIPEYISNPAASAATYTVSGVSTFDADARYYAADAGANDTYVITLSPAPAAYAVGQTFRFKANTANTGAATLNVNGLGAITIVKGVSTTLADGDIAANQINTVIYNGTNFVLQSPVSTAVTPIFNGSYKNGIDTSRAANAAASTQNITHGLGAVPKKIRITAIYASATGNVAVDLPMSWGSYDGTTNSSVYGVTNPNGGVNYGSSSTYGVYLFQSVGSDYQRAIITCDATNIILTWTNGGSGIGSTNINLMWEAEA